MKRDGGTSKSWRSSSIDSSPGDLLADINNRELSDLETCRRVWEHQQDPLALCEAIRLAGVDDWLRDALLVMMTAGVGSYPDRRRKMWHDRTTDARDATRACELAALRSHPELPSPTVKLPTWDMALEMAERFTRETYPSEAQVSASAVKKSYANVQKGRASTYRYFHARPGMQDLIRGAWQRHLDALRHLVRVLETTRAAGAVKTSHRKTAKK